MTRYVILFFRYEWSKDGELLQFRSGVSMSYSDGTLIIFDATRADEGDYRCKASNTEGEDSSSIMHLELYGKFVINCLFSHRWLGARLQYLHC